MVVGTRFGKLTVKALFNEDKIKKLQRALCVCDCGGSEDIRVMDLENEKIQSCISCRFKDTGHTFLYIRRKWLAQRENKPFELSKQEFFRKTSKPCFYCGSLPEPETYVHKGKKIVVACHDLDTVDRSKGYVGSNAIPCCRDCKKMRGDLGIKIFIKQVQKLHYYFKANVKGYE